MTVQEFHRKAIEFADIAFIKKFQGLIDEAKDYFRKALDFEKKASYQAQKEKIGEPTTSVLLKSAASLAMNCEEHTEAEKLICHALIGNPPSEIAEELRNLLEELYFQRHLKLQGISLNPSEIQLVVAGKGIGYGVAKSNLVFDRLNTFENLTYRTAERRLGKSFRAKGRVPNSIKENFQTYLSAPRAASLAFTIRLGKLSQQLEIEGFDKSEFNKSMDVIEDIIDNIGLVNKGEIETLKIKIPDETYFNNFIGLSKELAPDGKEINLVGLTIANKGKQKDVQFTRVRSDIISSNFEKALHEEDEKNEIDLVGRLYAANEDKSNINLKLDDGTNYHVKVPIGLNDIVKKYWGEQVKIKGITLKPKTVKLIDISPE